MQQSTRHRPPCSMNLSGTVCEPPSAWRAVAVVPCTATSVARTAVLKIAPCPSISNSDRSPARQSLAETGFPTPTSCPFSSPARALQKAGVIPSHAAATFRRCRSCTNCAKLALTLSAFPLPPLLPPPQPPSTSTADITTDTTSLCLPIQGRL